MDKPENFVPPETSGESTSVAAPILDEAEDDVQEDPLSILNEQASGQPDPPFADTTESLTRTAEPGPRRRDIGSILKPSMTSDEAALATAALSPGEKYLLITDPFVPDISYEFLKWTAMVAIARFSILGWLNTHGLYTAASLMVDSVATAPSLPKMRICSAFLFILHFSSGWR